VSPIGRTGGLVGAAVGLVAAAAAVGIAAERRAIGRSFRVPDLTADEPFGTLHGTAYKVQAGDGVALHAEVDQPDQGPLTIVMCHGYALNMDSWHFQRRDLKNVGRLVFWDLRGHGRSGIGDRKHSSIDQLGRDLARVIEALAPDGPLVLVGHSMGGMAVMAFAEQFPEVVASRVAGVALLSTSTGKLADVTLGAPAAIGRTIRTVAPRAMKVLGKRPHLVDHGRRFGSDLVFLVTKRYAFASDVPPSLVRFTEDMIASTSMEVMAEFYPALDAHEKLVALNNFNGIETLIMVGEGDLITPADHSREMLDVLPGAELVVVPDAGHLVIMEHPEIVNAQLRLLLSRAVRALEAAS
jgi:pimeloyl-ACP methyl ester carboxylesterase